MIPRDAFSLHMNDQRAKEWNNMELWKVRIIWNNCGKFTSSQSMGCTNRCPFKTNMVFFVVLSLLVSISLQGDDVFVLYLLSEKIAVITWAKSLWWTEFPVTRAVSIIPSLLSPISATPRIKTTSGLFWPHAKHFHTLAEYKRLSALAVSSHSSSNCLQKNSWTLLFCKNEIRKQINRIFL
jgi:hypothetical protein